MTEKSLEIVDCPSLERALGKGKIIRKLAVDIGKEHPHWIYAFKVPTGTDPSKAFGLFNSKPGSHYYKIRPNDLPEGPSSENGSQWDWYLLSCPHDPPCPLM
jgi:hypothetical protein